MQLFLPVLLSAIMFAHYSVCVWDVLGGVASAHTSAGCVCTLGKLDECVGPLVSCAFPQYAYFDVFELYLRKYAY